MDLCLRAVERGHKNSHFQSVTTLVGFPPEPSGTHYGPMRDFEVVKRELIEGIP